MTGISVSIAALTAAALASSPAITSLPSDVLAMPTSAPMQPAPPDQVGIGSNALAVAANGRGLTRGGQRFFWLGDTAWSLFHDLDREQVAAYLDVRAEQGFTVIQTAVIFPQAGEAGPNRYGDPPFGAGLSDLTLADSADPNDAGRYDYWDHVDLVVEQAAQRGLVLAILPVWADGQVSHLVTAANAHAYGRFLGHRYRAADNIVWIMGGEASVDGGEQIWRELAAGITAGGGTQPMIHHPRGDQRSIVWSADDDHSTDLDVRRDAWQAVLGAAAGHTYGHRVVRQFLTEDREIQLGARGTWTESLHAPGAEQMRHLRALMEALPRLEPANDVLTDPGSGTARIVAAADPDGGALVAYTPGGRPVTVDLTGLAGRRAHPWWYDPRTGRTRDLDPLGSGGTAEFTPPDEQDWVLVVEAEEDVPAPGPVPSGTTTDGGVPPTAPAGTSTSAGSAVATVLAFAHAQLGKPYEWGAAGPLAFDCSGLVMRAWQTADVQLPRASRDQARSGRQVLLVHAQPGDLLFWSDDGTAAGVYHVALYLGDGQIIEAPRPDLPVSVRQISWTESDLLGYAVRPEG